MKKKICISALAKDAAAVSELMKAAKTYGLEPGGHFWQDDLASMAWLGPSEELKDKGCALWVIAGPAEAFAKPATRLGLSLAAIATQGAKGLAFPVLLLPLSGTLDPAALPTPLQGAEVAKLGPTLGPKLAARANTPVAPSQAEYRLNLYGLPSVGLWFEVGPAKGRTWNGALLGTMGGDIVGHGVGPAGGLPDRCTLEYPMQGLKLDVGGCEHTAWGVSNKLDENASYYVGVKGDPSSILFGPLPEGDDAEVFRLSLA